MKKEAKLNGNFTYCIRSNIFSSRGTFYCSICILIFLDDKDDKTYYGRNFKRL